MKKLAIVVPCYNEEEVLHETSKRLKAHLDELISTNLVTDDSYIAFIDDGSADKTWEIIESLNSDCSIFKGIKLSRNKGHQNALLSGLINCSESCDILVSIDADLQDDISVIREMVVKNSQGFDVVYGVRTERTKDTIFKRFTAQFFYKMMLMMGVNIVYNHADYRLTSTRVIKALKDYKEVNLFLRGIFPTIGFSHSTVEYARAERFAGESKYPLRKMLSFAIDGITSFSIVPLRLVTFCGFFAFLLTCLLTVWAFYTKLTGNVIQGWSSTIISIYFLGAIQLISLGLIGEYIGKIYREVKARPRYIVEKSHL